ncbi:hybrid sensor histidine kinase/response regulator [Alkalinema sp. FACHB-956]|uniref:sensor histidine kinase n=1 Tax=Alkalinema sp. FACHB-956 TaxID=2692768 RepID=UPI0016861522|nr:hybrid sensor histidine kinase/response regulator [Alkalinema sp. FACHB-956]MBD2328344.1 hybrid sensor histidine kinase/response regulator [Alkalinema sp. FACHB-956]
MNHSPFAKPTKVDRILVVDDSADNSFLIQSLLQEEGYHIDIAENGQEALLKIETWQPDLILLDVMMPVMDGYEVTRRVRQNTALPFIPILLITAYDQLSVARGLDIGADDFIRKPVEFDELLARVRSLLRLKHSVDERDQIARQREDFVSRLTHDLRTPLVAADRMLSLLSQGVMGELSPDILEAIEIMSRSNNNLLTLVNTLLEVYRYEAGRKTLNFSPVDLPGLAQDVVKELSPLAIDKGLHLDTTEIPDQDAMLLVKGDRLELYRVLTNLIGNAIKFTDAGSVKVTVTVTPAAPLSTDGLRPMIQVAVEDTGQGIPPEEQASLFESFVQGKHKKSGSGLGLHLTRRIVEAHQGQIKVKSQVGQGSVFTVLLPAY